MKVLKILFQVFLQCYGTADVLDLAAIWPINYESDFYRIRFLQLAPQFYIELNTSVIHAQPVVLYINSTEMPYNKISLSVSRVFQFFPLFLLRKIYQL